MQIIVHIDDVIKMLTSSKLLTSSKIFSVGFFGLFFILLNYLMLFGDDVIYIVNSNFSFNMSSNIHKPMNENQKKTENKTKMLFNDINETKKRYLQWNKFSSLITFMPWVKSSILKYVTSLRRHNGNINNADIIKINIYSLKYTNTNQIWRTLTTTYKPCYNHNVYTPIEKRRTAFQNDVIIP